MAETRLNLTKSDGSSSDDEPEQVTTHVSHNSTDSSSEDESDEEFEIPPGFERVKGSGAITRESLLHKDCELWFFKLPKHLDASALANVSFKLDESPASSGKVLAKITTGETHKTFLLQSEDLMLTDQLVNALPLASDRSRFVLGKPFSRCFSLVEDPLSSVSIDLKDVSPEKRKRKKVSDKSMSKKVKQNL